MNGVDIQNVELRQDVVMLKRKHKLPDQATYMARSDRRYPAKQGTVDLMNSNSDQIPGSLFMTHYNNTKPALDNSDGKNQSATFSKVGSKTEFVPPQSHSIHEPTSAASRLAPIVDGNEISTVTYRVENKVAQDSIIEQNDGRNKATHISCPLALPDQETNNSGHCRPATCPAALSEHSQLGMPNGLSARKVSISKTLVQHRPNSSIPQNCFASKTLKVEMQNPNANSQPRNRIEALNDSIKLYSELLQLHLIHSYSSEVQVQWQRSAEAKYRLLYDGLSREHANVKHQEYRLQREVNMTALVSWCIGMGTAKASRAIGTLSDVVTETFDMVASDGKYTRTLETFEYWYAQACMVQQQRNENITTEAPITILEGIGDGWKAEAVNLGLRAITLLDRLRTLEMVQERSEGSDLARLARVLTTTLCNMVQELDTLQAIEVRIVSRERSWINSSLDQIATDMNSTLGILGPGSIYK